jgi:hypothetical protein
MSPLERRYRRLLWLLPPDHRAARGEELLGLLLDLDGARTRPSPRQTAGLVGLALRLRLVRAASLLLVAFLIAEPTWLAGEAYQAVTGKVTYESMSPLANVYVLLIVPTLMWLATAVVWLYGARRAALIVFGAYLALQLYSAGLGGVSRFDLVAAVLLGVAALGRWPAPRARLVMLATIPLAMALWLVRAMLPAGGGPTAGALLGITLVVCLVGAVGGAGRGHRRAAAEPS